MSDHEHHTTIRVRLPDGSWRVDPSGSEVWFRARTLFGLVPVHGFFGRFGGELLVDGAGAAHGELTIDAASIRTGIARRDRDLRGAAYLDAERHPIVTFTLDRVEAGVQHLNATGTLGLCGTAIALSFPLEAIAHGDHLHLEARVVIDHDAAGLGWARPRLVSRTVRADAALTLRRA